MPFVSVTRLKLSSILYLFSFMRTNEASVKSIKVAEGLIAAKELMDKGWTFWTLTVWENEAAMKAFRNRPAHRQAMQKLPVWCSEASYVHWVQDDATVPDWLTASTKLVKEGKLTKLRNPSARHTAGAFPPAQRTTTERIIKSAKA